MVTPGKHLGGFCCVVLGLDAVRMPYVELIRDGSGLSAPLAILFLPSAFRAASDVPSLVPLAMPRQPSNAYLIHVLDGTEDAPVASPLRGVILSVPDVPSADEEEVEDAAGGSSVERHRSGGKGRSKTKKMRRRTVGGGASSARSSSARDRYREGEAVPVGLEAVLLRARLSGIPGAYEEESTVRDAKGRVKTILAGVRIGRGLALYHKFAQGERAVGLKSSVAGS